MIEETSSGQNVVETLNKEIAQLLSVTRRALKRVRAKLQKQNEELKEANEHSRFAHIADSLLAHPDAVPRGATSIALENIHSQTTEDVTLDPARSVFENAEAYYRRSRKGKRGVSIIEGILGETRREEVDLARILETLEALRAGPALDYGEIVAIVQESRTALENLGILPRSQTKKARAEAGRVPYRRLTLDGWDIYVGKNDAQNDELSTRFARPWDLWMHVAACAGSHVVIRRDKNAPWPPKDLLLRVASFAVWFSKAKHTSYSDVHVTEARFVHKRRHAPPGEVIAERCKTLRVSPQSPQEFFGGDSDK